MDEQIKFEEISSTPATESNQDSNQPVPNLKGKTKNKSTEKDGTTNIKRRCVSTACIACRRRKSKCDGNLPACAACASVYLTECEYAPHTDHRRKGVYKKDVDNLKTKNSTLQTLIQAILNYDEEDVPELIRQIRTSDNLEELAESIVAKEKRLQQSADSPDSPVYPLGNITDIPQFETELSGRMGDLWLDGSVKFIGGTSNLIWLPNDSDYFETTLSPGTTKQVVRPKEEAILSWTTVTHDKELILHFMNMYFCWHYAYFTTLSKELFYRDFLQGTPSQYCSALLVNVMLTLGCHFSSRPEARSDPEDSATTGDHYFAEAKRLMHENDEFAMAKLCTVQALALMSVREAGCGRESKGWVYSGMSFRMASDLGLNVDAPAMNEISKLQDEDIDARRITFWGCFLFDKCWSNYLGRQPQLELSNITVKKPVVFGSEDSEMWSPYTDSGILHAHAQPARTRAIALQISKLAEISSDLLTSFYHPQQLGKPVGKQAELKKLSDLHTRLEAWKRDLPAEMEPREGQLPQVLLMHMFFQLLFIHLYRPFLKYTQTTSPLPNHVSPRKFCTAAAAAVSKLFRLYKRTHGLRQICNIAVYIAHSACTIHLLNLPDKNARRDIVHGIKHLEEIGECWTCARRTLRILALCAEKWKVELPEDAVASFARARARWGMTEPAVSPISSGTLADIQSQTMSPPMPETMARHVQKIAPAQPQIQPRQPYRTPIVQLQNGLNAAQAQSPPLSSETRRSSGNMSLPPQSAADLNRGTGKLRSSIQLTKEQKDAWHAHVARMNLTSNSSSSAAQVTPDANIVFGGIDTLIEENQDWWLKDQASLASGFDNWMDPHGDWSSFGLETGVGTMSNTSTYTAPYHMNVTQNGYMNFNTSGVRQGQSVGAPMNGWSNKPYTTFDDEMYF